MIGMIYETECVVSGSGLWLSFCLGGPEVHGVSAMPWYAMVCSGDVSCRCPCSQAADWDGLPWLSGALRGLWILIYKTNLFQAWALSWNFEICPEVGVRSWNLYIYPEIFMRFRNFFKNTSFYLFYLWVSNTGHRESSVVPDFSIKWRVEVIQGHSLTLTGKPINYFMSPYSYFSLNSKRSEVICAVFCDFDVLKNVPKFQFFFLSWK